MDALFSRTVRANGRTYFIDVRETQANEKYISIAESKRDPKEEGKFIRSSIMLFGKNFDPFVEALGEAMTYARG